MKNYIKYFLVLSLILTLWSCDSSNEEEPLQSSQGTEYYIKYEADVTSVYNLKNIKYTVNTDVGEQTFTSGKSFSQTFGPVKKGFQASIGADASSPYTSADCNVRIYISKGNEPFALKASKSGYKIVSTSYIIDY